MSQWQVIWGGNYFDLPPSQGFFIWDKVQPQNFSLAMCEFAWSNKQAPAKMFRKSVLSYTKQHPTQKPVELMEWCLTFFHDAQTVLDPFAGSGSTGVACIKQGKYFIGVEKDEDYFHTAVKRLAAAADQGDLFEASVPAPPVVIPQTGELVFG